MESRCLWAVKSALGQRPSYMKGFRVMPYSWAAQTPLSNSRDPPRRQLPASAKTPPLTVAFRACSQASDDEPGPMRTSSHGPPRRGPCQVQPDALDRRQRRSNTAYRRTRRTAMYRAGRGYRLREKPMRPNSVTGPSLVETFMPALNWSGAAYKPLVSTFSKTWPTTAHSRS